MATTDEELNLWPPQLGTTTVRSPLAIMKRQASLLGSATRNQLEGEVQTRTAAKMGFRHDFHIVAPGLDNYRFGLFSVYHPVTLYPLEVWIGDASATQCNDEEAFIEAIRTVLQSEETRKVLDALLSQLGAIIGEPVRA